MKQFICSLCSSKEVRNCYQARDFDNSEEVFDLVQCTACGLAMTSPAPKPDEMDKYYPETYYGDGDKKFSGLIEYLTILGCKLRAKRILKEISRTEQGDRTRKVLDVGCGRANLLRCLKELGCECHGTERSVFPATSRPDGVAIFNGSVVDGEYKDGFFDAVIIWHVLEHLDDPFETLEEISRITREDGIIAIAVPNFSSLQSKWFKSDWFHLDLPRHLYHFSSENLCRVLKQKGYSIQSVSTSSLEQNIFGFIQSFMNKLKFPGRPNEFYKLIQKRSGLKQFSKLLVWLIIAILILPLALIEFVMSLILKKGASAIIIARKNN